MKKYVFIFVSFIFMMLLFTTKIEAKSNTQDDITISFGDEDSLNLGYSRINTFKIRNDNSFYFGGVKYQINDEYSLINNTLQITDNVFSLNDISFTIDENKKEITSNKTFETYNFKVNVDNPNNKTYTFKQRICFKYSIDSIITESCNEDIDDFSEINASSLWGYYYDFMPFYDNELVFEYITYKFTLVNDESSLVFDDLTFTKNEIIYTDYFTLKTSNYYGQYTSSYNGKDFVIPEAIDMNNNLVISVEYAPSSISLEARTYYATFNVCVGTLYNQCQEVDYTEKLTTTSKWVYRIPLANIEYDRKTGKVNHSSFKLYGTYVYKGESKDKRYQKVITKTDEIIYQLDLYATSLENKLEGVSISGTSCGTLDGCYSSNKEVTNTFKFTNDNQILTIHYYISDTFITDYSLLVEEFNNGDKITLTSNEGWKFISFKILDEAGRITYLDYGYLFDYTPPIVSSSNLKEYKEDSYYNKFQLNVLFEDNYFGNDIANIYYLIVEKDDDVTEENLISSNLIYNKSTGVVIDSSFANKSYKVCFLAQDPVGNYSDVECSNSLNLDTIALSKEEVSVESDNNNYQKRVAINISIKDVNITSIKCLLVKEGEVLSDSNQLTSTCNLNQFTYINISDESRYKLWIYAPDRANNYSLLELDRVYLIDSIAPRVTYVINGDNLVYSNNVSIKLNVEDLNSTSTKYGFYLSSYNENDFISLSEDNIIKYPYGYYGIYRLVIKTCDNINNCNITTLKDNFYIDSADITLVLKGKEKIKVLRWGEYKEKGASASKGSGKYNTSIDYSIAGEVDTSKVGVYYLTYTSGSGINKVSIIREVEVVDSAPLIISFVGLLALGEVIILLRIFIKRKKNDSI